MMDFDFVSSAKSDFRIFFAAQNPGLLDGGSFVDNIVIGPFQKLDLFDVHHLSHSHLWCLSRSCGILFLVWLKTTNLT